MMRNIGSILHDTLIVSAYAGVAVECPWITDGNALFTHEWVTESRIKLWS
jgi:hypothetical protein